MRKLLLLTVLGPLWLLTFPLIPIRAQVQEPAENRGAAAAYQALLRLRTPVTVLYITAHPDDEDAALMTWLARREGVRTGLLTLTRGEGGANLIGAESYDALGILRTEELLAAGRVYGLDAQFFTRMADFGFSKRLDETLDQWGKQNVLGDCVRVVRTYRPDILISRFHGKRRDGHGNHQAAGMLSFEVFKAAADPNAFPEQIAAGLRPWQPKKLYLSTRGNEPSTLKIDVREYSPLLGRSYREIGMEGYGMHRSQSVGLARPVLGRWFSSLQLVESVLPKVESEKSLFDGLDIELAGMARLAPALHLEDALAKLQTLIADAVNKFDARAPERSASQLAAAARIVRGAMKQAKEPRADQLLFLLSNKEREINDAINKVLGVRVDALVESSTPASANSFFQPPRQASASVVPGQRVNIRVRSFAAATIQYRSTWIEMPYPQTETMGIEAGTLEVGAC